MEHDSAFLVRGQDTIISKLAILRKNKCLIRVAFGEDGDSFITTILDINKNNRNIIFCYGPPRNLTDKLYHSSKIVFETEYHGIKVSFTSNKMTEIRYQGAAVYTAPLPDSLLWLEARDYYRVRIPLSKPSYCLVTPNTPDQDPVKLRLCDISLTGFSILDNSNDMTMQMDPNMQFKNCKLLLPAQEVNVSFEVRHRFVIKQGHVTRAEKIGCKFLNSSPAFESIVQSYMLQIEREYRQSIVAENGGLVSSSPAAETSS